jgi:capsular polysaccharide export protein
MAAPTRERLFIYTGGFVAQTRLRRILALAGYDLRIGWPRAQDRVGLWGQGARTRRGLAVARTSGAGALWVEDGFLRSVRTGRSGDAPLSLLIDRQGVHFDPKTPSDLEQILTEHPLDDPDLLDRARATITTLQQQHLSKYNNFDPAAKPPDAGYVLVIDQTRDDAAVRASGADARSFAAMLACALAEHPDRRIVIKTHPETSAGQRQGYLAHLPLNDPRVTIWNTPVSPWALLGGAVAVYTISSQLGFEAILQGHRPVIFGQPFYSGWHLSDDRNPPPRRGRALTALQLCAAALILYPVYYDPYHDRLCQIEDALRTLTALSDAWRWDHQGWVAQDMRLWKRQPLQQFFGQYQRLHFAKANKPVPKGRRVMRWASSQDREAVLVEDGFLRSRGLGADLVAPLSLVLDDLGIYYNPQRPSRLERIIAHSPPLADAEYTRAQQLIAQITAAGLSKYNLRNPPMPALPTSGQRILVPGQVEDDASVQWGGIDGLRSNAALLAATRAANPDAVIIYKPHPDVRAGLRAGSLTNADHWADVVLQDTDPIAAIKACDAIWTITSLLGFEALLHNRPVTCLGMPFYAGWGLTTDLCPKPARRDRAVDLPTLVHAALIRYPRYRDPVTGLPCPVEIIAHRLHKNQIPPAPWANRSLAKLQGVFASMAPFWR